MILVPLRKPKSHPIWGLSKDRCLELFCCTLINLNPTPHFETWLTAFFRVIINISFGINIPPHLYLFAQDQFMNGIEGTWGLSDIQAAGHSSGKMGKKSQFCKSTARNSKWLAKTLLLPIHFFSTNSFGVHFAAQAVHWKQGKHIQFCWQ